MSEHEAVYIGEFMCDQYTCTCGWKGNSYFDGDYWAYQEFAKHKEAAEGTPMTPPSPSLSPPPLNRTGGAW